MGVAHFTKQKLIDMLVNQVRTADQGEQELGFEMVMTALEIATLELDRINELIPQWIEDQVRCNEWENAANTLAALVAIRRFAQTLGRD